MRNKSTGGFTLIELLIVIAIIGILAAVLIPNLLSARTRAFDTAAQSCARSIATAQEIYAIDSNGAYGAWSDISATGTDYADTISNCTDDANINTPASATAATFEDGTGWEVDHENGSRVYTVSATGLTDVAK